MNNREQQAQQERRQSAKAWAEQASTGGWTPTSVKFPKDWKKLKWENDLLTFDIIPFVAGWGNKDADEGFLVWARRYGQHRFPRPDGEDATYICLWETFGKPCYVCKRCNDKTMGEQMKIDRQTKPRLLLIVNDELDRNLTGPFKILDEAFFNRKLGFGQKLVSTIQRYRGTEDFFDLENGLQLQVSVAGQKFHQVDAIDFYPRQYKYDVNLYKSMPCLDDCIIVPRPSGLTKPLKEFTDADWHAVNKELERIYNGGSVEGAEETTSSTSVSPPANPTSSVPDAPKVPGVSSSPPLAPPPPSPPKQKTANDLGLKVMDSVEYNGGPCSIIRISADGLFLMLEDAKEDLHQKVPVEKVVKKEKKTPAPAKVDTSESPDDDDIPF